MIFGPYSSVSDFVRVNPMSCKSASITFPSRRKLVLVGFLVSLDPSSDSQESLDDDVSDDSDDLSSPRSDSDNTAAQSKYRKSSDDSISGWKCAG